jgi:hypothetical protein
VPFLHRLHRRKNSPALPLLDPTEYQPTPYRLASPPAGPRPGGPAGGAGGASGGAGGGGGWAGGGQVGRESVGTQWGPVGAARVGCRQDFVAEAGASRKSVGSWELFVGT